MFTIPVGLRILFACIAAIAGILAGILGQALWQNIVYSITKRGRKPNPRPFRLWLAFIISVFATVICGTLVTVAATLESPPPTQIAWVYVTPVEPSERIFPPSEQITSRPSVNCVKLQLPISQLAASPDGKMLASLSGDLLSPDVEIRVWLMPDVSLMRTVKSTISPHTSIFINSIVFSPDNLTLVVGMPGQESTYIDFFDVNSGKLINEFEATLRVKGTGLLEMLGVNDLAFSPDGMKLAAGLDDGSARIWNVLDGTLLHTLVHEGNIPSGGIENVRGVFFTPDSKILITAHSYAILFWDIGTGKQLKVHRLENDQVETTFAFSPNGQLLASGEEDGPIKIWSIEDGRLINIFEGHTDKVNALAFSLDSKALASASNDNSIRLWDATTGKLIQSLLGHTSAVNTVTFFSDSATLASGSTDQMFCLWKLQLR